MAKCILILLFGVLYLNSNAQFYEYGQDPGSLKWEYIESENFKIIHPSGFEEKAEQVLRILDRYYLLNSSQLNHKPEKIPVILHTHTVRSNGFVMWAPKRMEFFMYPDIEGVAQDWYSHLALHEFRHVVQVDKLNKGLSKVLTTILGQQGIGPAAGMMSFWFIEGDAVYAETSLSQSGRGRTPAFEMKIKAQLLSDDEPHSFSKSYLGSFKDFVPDYYSYGYQMVSYGRMKYGLDIWSKALDQIGKRPYLIDPMLFYLKRLTGEGKAGLYNNTMSYLKQHWKEQAEQREIDMMTAVNPVDHKFYTSYRSPELSSDSSVIAIKSGFAIINRFVRIAPDGSEKLLYIPGYLHSGRIDIHDDKILWDELIPDPRWSNQSFSDLKIYDINKKTLQRLSYHKRYSTPAFSPSGDTVIAVETTVNNDFFLLFLSPEGKYYDRIPSPGNIQILDPAWMNNTDKIVVVSVDEEGKKIWWYDRSEKNWEMLFNSRYFNISSPDTYGKHVIFHGTFSGIDDIYALDTENRQLHKLSDSRFGSFQPGVSEELGRFTWSYYTDEGYNLGTSKLEPEKWNVFEIPEVVTEQAFFNYGDSSLLPPVQKNTEISTNYNSGKFRKTTNLFRLHSWAPYWFDYTDPSLGNVGVGFPGITLLSQNLLSTTVSYAGYEYTRGDHYVHAGITYKGWKPVFDFSVTWGGPPRVSYFEDKPALVRDKNLRFSMLSYLPLRYVAGRWITGLRPSLEIAYNRNYFYYTSENDYRSGMVYFEPRLYSYFYQRSAYLDLIPRWGITLDMNAVSAPFEEEQLGNAWGIRSNIYLPGFMRNHGLKLRAEIQEQDPDRYLFSNLVSFPRGYEPYTSKSLTRLTADYMLPLLYPDLDVFGLLYLKRIRASLFTDYISGEDMYVPAENKYEVINGTFRSHGIELTFDYHPLRLLVPLNSGIRVNYLENSGEITFDAIFSVDFGF